MDIVNLRRQNIAWAIEQNPTNITINRTEKIFKGGGFDEVQSEAGPFTVRIFNRTTQTPKEIDTLAGAKHVDITWGLLATHKADIQAGPRVKDEFDVEGMGTFQVIAVYPQIVQGKIVGYQAELERVN